MDAIGITVSKQHGCYDKGMAIEVMRQQQMLMLKLRALVLPLLRTDDPSAELIVHLIEQVIICNTSVISKLIAENTSMINDGRLAVVTKSTMYDRNVEREQKPINRKRRKNETRSLVTDAPHYDGYQWRKYGQKVINGMMHPRCYYRCTNSKEQNCQAAKTVQKQGNDNLGTGDDTPKYTVVYFGHHTCKNNNHNVERPCTIVNSDNRNTVKPLEMPESAMDSELSALLKEFTDIPVDPPFWVMDEDDMARFEQASSPVLISGFSF